MEWMSPSIVPITILPLLSISEPNASSAGVRTSTPAVIASEAAITCGRNNVPASNWSPTSFMAAVKPSWIISTGLIPASSASWDAAAAASLSKFAIASFAFAIISSFVAIFTTSI